MGDARRIVDEWLAAQPELDVERLDDHTWATMLAGESKRTIPVTVAMTSQHLTVQSFFMRAPDEQADQLYRYLLSRHTRSYVLRFAVTDEGDILLLGLLPVQAVTASELDTLFGQLLTVADDAFATALRLGFTSYIEREQAWRAKTGLPRNPIT